MKISKQHPLVAGTILLTATGLISRLIGFFYRIYLSRLFGEEGMGIYQLLGPVLSISFSLTAAGYQTAVSKMVAESVATCKRPSAKPVWVGLSISLPLSCLCTAVVYLGADFIAQYLLQEPRTTFMLKILAFSIPFSSVHACINGYFYGIKRAGSPAVGQLFEQLVRVGCVYFFSAYSLANGTAPSVTIAVWGLAIGEFCSLIQSIVSFLPYCSPKYVCRKLSKAYVDITASNKLSSGLRSTHPGRGHGHPCAQCMSLYPNLLAMVLPLTANRIVLNILQSVESVSLPSKLRLYGYDTVTSLSVYGVLTGMAMPFIFFPNALTGSVAVLLLPIISEKYALGDMTGVRQATLRTVKYCSLMGIGCLIIFVSFGDWMGSTLFDSPLAGYFIKTLGFLCPFLYLDTTLSSILQGLGQAGKLFIMNVISLLVRLAFVFLVVPHFGITGYLWGLLAGQIITGILYLSCLGHFLTKTKNSGL